MHSATFPENQTQTPTVQPHNLGTLQSLNRPGTLLYTKTESSEAVCATGKALLKLVHSTGQQSQAQQQIYKRMTKKENNQGVVLWWDLK